MDSDGDYIFEFYDEDYGEEPAEEPQLPAEPYNEVDFEADLNDEQLEIVNNIKGPMLVIAGAGSGKTRTITYAVAKLLVSGVRPFEIMLVTFTNKAAQEMIKRVETLLGTRPKGIWAGTFHSMANRFLRMYVETSGLKPNYTIMDESEANSLMKLAREKAEVTELEERFPNSSMCKAILSYSINCHKSIREVIQWKYPQFDNPDLIPKLKEVYRIYDTKKRKDGLIDFDDLLVYWSALLDQKLIARMIARRIKYVLVDEYQDTNWLQDDIIYKIVSQNADRNVIAVGDDAQSIYAFRGANFKNILMFKDKYTSCKLYYITYNYRSTPEILALANDSIQHNTEQFKKEMQPTRSSGIKPFRVNTTDDEEQAKFIANQVLKLREEGVELHQMAVLFRASYHSLKIEMKLRTKNIHYEVRAGVSFFEKAHIKDLLVHLKIIENPHDEVSWSRIFSIIPGIGTSSGVKIFAEIAQSADPIEAILDPHFFIGRMKGERIPTKGRKNLVAHLRKLHGITSDNKPSEIILDIIDILKDYIQSTYENWEDRLDDLKQLSVYAQNYSSITKFLEVLSLNKTNIESKMFAMGSSIEEERPLILSTIHRAKGLEWRVIFIPMLAEDMFPPSRVVVDKEDFEEERRVFYVAITRAKDKLYLICPAMIQSYRGYQTARLSPFVEELAPETYKPSKVKFRPQKRSKKSPNKPTFQSAADLLK